MPTYAYACTECSHTFDIYQSFTDDALTECPECGAALRKVFSPVGVVFKGSGFYRNDARTSTKGSSRGSNGKDGSKDPSSKGSDSGSKGSDSGSKGSDSGSAGSGSSSSSSAEKSSSSGGSTTKTAK